MRRIWTRLSLAAALLSTSIVPGQQPAQNRGNAPAQPKDSTPPAKPDPNSLEGLIGDALKSHPDIRVAEAKVRDAEALLNQARFQVIQQVSTAYSAVQDAKFTQNVLEVVLEKQLQLSKTGVYSEAEIKKAQLDLERGKAELAKREADLNLLVGRSSGRFRLTQVQGTWEPLTRWNSVELNADRTLRLWDARDGHAVTFDRDVKVASGSMAEKIRAALKTNVKIDAGKEALPVAEVIEYLKKKAGIDVPFRVHGTFTPSAGGSSPASGGPISLMSGELPLSAWLAMIEDSMPSAVFVVREYGILMTARDRVPDGAMRLSDFLRSTEPKKDEPKKP